eukprot:362702_1
MESSEPFSYTSDSISDASPISLQLVQSITTTDDESYSYPKVVDYKKTHLTEYHQNNDYNTNNNMITNNIMNNESSMTAIDLLSQLPGIEDGIHGIIMFKNGYKKIRTISDTLQG